MRALIGLILLCAACGENVPPTVQDIRLSNPSVRRFQEFFVTLVSVEDADGNVYAGRVWVKASGGDVELEEEIRPFETEPDRSKGDVIIGVRLTGDIPTGPWDIQAIFQDEAGADAAPRTARITLTP